MSIEDDACESFGVDGPIAITLYLSMCLRPPSTAVIAQLGERKTEDLKVSGSIPDCGSCFDRSTFYENNTLLKVLLSKQL